MNRVGGVNLNLRILRSGQHRPCAAVYARQQNRSEYTRRIPAHGHGQASALK